MVTHGFQEDAPHGFKYLLRDSCMRTSGVCIPHVFPSPKHHAGGEVDNPVSVCRSVRASVLLSLPSFLSDMEEMSPAPRRSFLMNFPYGVLCSGSTRHSLACELTLGED